MKLCQKCVNTGTTLVLSGLKAALIRGDELSHWICQSVVWSHICPFISNGTKYGPIHNTDSQQTPNNCIAFIQRRPNVFAFGPTLYKCYTNIVCLLGCETLYQ